MNTISSSLSQCRFRVDAVSSSAIYKIAIITGQIFLAFSNCERCNEFLEIHHSRRYGRVKKNNAGTVLVTASLVLGIFIVLRVCKRPL